MTFLQRLAIRIAARDGVPCQCDLCTERRLRIMREMYVPPCPRQPPSSPDRSENRYDNEGRN